MQLLDFDGECRIERDEDLLSRLRSVRRGSDGAFVLDHGGDESLWVHINGEAAFLYYFPFRDGRQAGFVPNDMWQGEHLEVRFLLVDGFESDAIFPPWYQLVTVDTAYQAAIEFLHSPSLPESLTWLEL